MRSTVMMGAMSRERMGGYFDYNATAPMSAAAIVAMSDAMEDGWWNPSSLYRGAAEVRHRLEMAREDVAEILGLEPGRVVFTSGATESNNAVMAWAANGAGGPGVGPGGSRCLVGAVEHPSVREPARRWLGERMGDLPVDAAGRVRLEDLEGRLSRGDAGLVSVMAANNETGVVQPWRAAAELCRERGVLFHCDAAQWVGRLAVDGLGACGFVTASAHKFGGPKGIGLLVTPDEGGFAGQVGGPQEDGRRAGTENFPAVAGMVAALRERMGGLVENDERARRRDRFEREALRRVPGLRIVGSGAERLWNTSMLVLPAVSNLKWLTRLDRLGFQVSTGSACSAGRGNPSHVMAAMSLDHDEMGRVLRVSGGWDTTEDDWLGLAEALETVHRELATSGRSPRILPAGADGS